MNTNQSRSSAQGQFTATRSIAEKNRNAANKGEKTTKNHPGTTLFLTG
ncbi:hypothetical protein [Pantoea sp. CCBC3-3-1]|nr:hypothetical protein [Pantoea sp. CCBC3-3-1]